MNGEHRTPVPEPEGRGDTVTAHADSFARLALANITREYPNFPGHLLGSSAELVPPRSYHPAFYGAYDWHSAVHMHWLLIRLLRLHGAHVDADRISGTLDSHLTPEALATESEYLRAHPSFERPYGWAWLLALAAECAALGARSWTEAMRPAVRTVTELVLEWLPKANYPVRHGTHTNSAFALGLMLDSAEGAGVPELAAPVAAKVRAWFGHDKDAGFHWEPSGQDFLSPVLCEADAMRRVLTPPAFKDWLAGFLPGLRTSAGPFLTPPHITDAADPQIGHLYGLCFSRAAALWAIAGSLPAGDPLTGTLGAAARGHLAAGLPAIGSGDFTTDHWLATFAVLAMDAAAVAPPD